MPDERPRAEELAWLLEPPPPGQINLHIAIGDEVDLSPDARQALEDLMSHMQEDEVMGHYVPCGGLRSCPQYDCHLGKCQPLMRMPCVAEITCGLAE